MHFQLTILPKAVLEGGVRWGKIDLKVTTYHFIIHFWLKTKLFPKLSPRQFCYGEMILKISATMQHLIILGQSFKNCFIYS